MKKEMTAEEKLQQEAYEKYKLEWMRSQGHSLTELKQALIEIMEEMTEEGESITCAEDVAPFVEAAVETFLDERGFGGSLYACKDEFLDEEYQHRDYVEYLMGRPCPEYQGAEKTAFVSFSVEGTVATAVRYSRYSDTEETLIKKAADEFVQLGLDNYLHDMRTDPLRIQSDILSDKEETAFVSFSVKGCVTVPVDHKDGDTEDDLVRKGEYELDELDLERHMQDMKKDLLCIHDEDDRPLLFHKKEIQDNAEEIAGTCIDFDVPAGYFTGPLHYRTEARDTNEAIAGFKRCAEQLGIYPKGHGGWSFVFRAKEKKFTVMGPFLVIPCRENRESFAKKCQAHGIDISDMKGPWILDRGPWVYEKGPFS